ncbi:hypothetical protein G6F57_021528 [Rhizopus arrhizus]|nr:hypothetical protein G6F57_021528 [Rhizopus arrhizus]
MVHDALQGELGAGPADAVSIAGESSGSGIHDGAGVRLPRLEDPGVALRAAWDTVVGVVRHPGIGHGHIRRALSGRPKRHVSGHGRARQVVGGQRRLGDVQAAPFGLHRIDDECAIQEAARAGDIGKSRRDQPCRAGFRRAQCQQFAYPRRHALIEET